MAPFRRLKIQSRYNLADAEGRDSLRDSWGVRSVKMEEGQHMTELKTVQLIQ